MPPFTVRLANEDDCSGLLPSLMRQTFSDTFGALYHPSDLEAYLASAYDPAVLRRELTESRSRLWIVEDGALDGRAVAYAQVGQCGLPHPDAAASNFELRRIYVLKSHQGQGLGKLLIELALSWAHAPDAGFTGPLWVGVYSGNLRAQRFYASYGFEKVGEYDFPVGAGPPDREFILRKERSQEREGR